MHDIFHSLQVFLISFEFFHNKMRVMRTLICTFSNLCALFQQPLLERFLNRAAEGFRNLFTAVEDHFELCLAKCRTSSQVRLWDLANARRVTSDRCTIAAPVRVTITFFDACFRAFNTRTPTETLRQSTATASPLRSYFLYKHSGTSRNK